MRRGEWLTAGGGAALLAAMFMPWFGTAPAENPFIPPAREVTVNAWRSFATLDLILFATAAAALATAVLAAPGADRRRRAQVRLATAGLSLVSTALVVYRIADPIPNTTVRFGIVLGLIACVAILAGTQLSNLEERRRVLAYDRRPHAPAPPA